MKKDLLELLEELKKYDPSVEEIKMLNKITEKYPKLKHLKSCTHRLALIIDIERILRRIDD